MIYFSATGNSRFIARVFAKEMNCACHSIEEQVDFATLIAAADIVGFAYPIFGSRMPAILRDFVKKNAELIQTKELAVFCTQMAFSGDGARAFTYIFPPRKRKDLDIIYADHFIMPNNVGNIIILPLAKDKTARRYFVKASWKMQSVCDDIKAGIVKKRGFNPVSRALGLIQGTFMPILEWMGKDRVRIGSDCTNCGICVKKCPMKNLACEDGKIIAKGNCIMCYRCVNFCPQKCITTFIHTRVKAQYRGPKR